MSEDSLHACASSVFVQEVHHVLQHLYDPLVLRASPLMELLDLGERGPTALRDILLQAIERFKPRPGTREGMSAWRPYRALFHRYVEQFTQREVADVLSLSIRQMRREEKRALTGLADELWSRYGVSKRPTRVLREAPSPAESEAEQAPTRRDELEWIGQSSPDEIIDVVQLVESVVRVARPLARNLGITVRTELPSGPPNCAGQRDTLRQALLNALTLALRAVSGGCVYVKAEITESCLELSIAPQAVTDASRASPEGLGEALEMIRDLLSLSGGSLVYVEGDASGRPFRLILGLPILARRAVLIVDDNADTLELYRRFLRASPYLVDTVSDPQRVLRRAIGLDPDAIILDVMLPGTDGWEVLERLREHPQTRDIPVLVCSILLEDQLALALGAAAYLRKPVTRTTLLAALEKWVAWQQRDG